MEIYLLKSVACLSILLLFYKLLLEKENMHRFKRFFLLASVIISILIPFVTFTTYVEVPQENSALIYEGTFVADVQNTETEINFLPFILWSIYGLGVLFFSFAFFKNLRELILKIKRNPKFRKDHITNVLLQEEVAPHTFWDYIFLNKQKFEENTIPQEVFQHEEAHARQKHSLDILFVELLQIIFWFNPLIYLTKNAIKLNHEFLADRAVLQKGADTARYQETLLSFSSSSSSNRFAHPIHYSLIKKRFTIMKTKTSKTAIWVRTLLLLPLLSALLYACSTKEIVEKKEINSSTIQDSSMVTPGKVTSKITAKNNGMADSRILQDSLVPVQEKATPEMIAEYNKMAQYHNSMPKDFTFIKVKDYKRMKYIYELMTVEQKKEAEKFPIPSPPPPPAPPVPDAEKMSPPPPPPAPEEAIEKWAAEGAEFFLNGKKITAKKALYLVQEKNGKNLNIHIERNNSERTIFLSEKKMGKD